VDLNLNPTQAMLAESARALFAKHLPQSKLWDAETSNLGYEPEIWKLMVEAGWTTLGVPEPSGVSNGDLIHLGVLLEEMGRAALASPFFQTVLAAYALGRYGDQPAAAAALAKIAAGGRAALILPPDEFRFPAVQQTSVGAYLLESEPMLVEWGHQADLLVCPVEASSEFILFVLDPDAAGLHREAVASFDTERISRVSFNGVRADPANRVTRATMSTTNLDALRAVRDILRCAEMIGGGRRVLEMMVEHLSSRQQFGHPIASFQAVQHACADVAIQLDGARLATYEALWRATGDRPFAKEAAVAALFTGQACERAVSTAAQLFGGVGYTREFYLHFYYRRAKAQQLRLGSQRNLLEKLACAVLDVQKERADVSWQPVT
jgi:alkylation response protein AidB-like acyl-CoA dehydrogenase